MTRNRRSARQAGTEFERLMADWLAIRLDDDRIDRRVKTGSQDRGDIAGVRHMGGRIVIECKDYGGRLRPAEWADEVEVERGNDDALAGVVFAKRKGTRDPAKQWVLMTAEEYAAHITGYRAVEE